MTTNNSYKLADSTISQLIQLIQMGILTGTDISDQIRTLSLIVDEDEKKIMPCPDYMETFQENLKRMQSIESTTD